MSFGTTCVCGIMWNNISHEPCNKYVEHRELNVNICNGGHDTLIIMTNRQNVETHMYTSTCFNVVILILKPM